MKKVTVGKNAYVFHDQSTGITVCKGEVVELNSNQFNSRKIKQALNSGHLQLVLIEEPVDGISTSELTKLEKKIQKDFNKGVTLDKIASYVTLPQAKALAEKQEVTVDENDTVKDILSVILEEES